MTDYKELLRDIFSKNGMSQLLADGKDESFNLLINDLIATNRQYNLTAIKEPSEIVLKHIVDSLTLLEFIPQDAKMLDVGTGAGFPALPIAIARPDVTVTALDSTSKKLAFIDKTAESLALTNIKTCHGRAEELSHTAMRSTFDIVTARAVAYLPLLSELCIPFLRIGGKFIAMKGDSAKEEAAVSEKALEILGCKKPVLFVTEIKSGDNVLQHNIIVSEKFKQTSNIYPRIFSAITKKPLQ